MSRSYDTKDKETAHKYYTVVETAVSHMSTG